MSTLTITTENIPAGPVLHIRGHLDFHTAPQLREALDGTALRPGQRLVLELAGLEFCDSSGITAFLVARNLAIAAQADIALAAVPDNTARILRIVGLDQIFPIHPHSRSGAAEDGG